MRQQVYLYPYKAILSQLEVEVQEEQLVHLIRAHKVQIQYLVQLHPLVVVQLQVLVQKLLVDLEDLEVVVVGQPLADLPLAEVGILHQSVLLKVLMVELQDQIHAVIVFLEVVEVVLLQLEVKEINKLQDVLV